MTAIERTKWILSDYCRGDELLESMAECIGKALDRRTRFYIPALLNVRDVDMHTIYLPDMRSADGEPAYEQQATYRNSKTDEELSDVGEVDEVMDDIHDRMSEREDRISELEDEEDEIGAALSAFLSEEAKRAEEITHLEALVATARSLDPEALREYQERLGVLRAQQGAAEDMHRAHKEAQEQNEKLLSELRQEQEDDDEIKDAWDDAKDNPDYTEIYWNYFWRPYDASVNEKLANELTLHVITFTDSAPDSVAGKSYFSFSGCGMDLSAAKTAYVAIEHQVVDPDYVHQFTRPMDFQSALHIVPSRKWAEACDALGILEAVIVNKMGDAHFQEVALALFRDKYHREPETVLPSDPAWALLLNKENA